MRWTVKLLPSGCSSIPLILKPQGISITPACSTEPLDFSGGHL